MGVSFGGVSIFSKVRQTPTFEQFIVGPKLLQSFQNFNEGLLACLRAEENLFEGKRPRFE